LKKYILLALFTLTAFFAKSQTIDSLYFNLYTDSLKKGTYNYINIDAKYTNGKILPLMDNDLIFTCNIGKFERNCLIVPIDIKEEKITIIATLKSNKSITKSITIYIKRNPDNEVLKTTEEIIRDLKKNDSNSGSKKKTKKKLIS
jgi:hypothetical protein